MRAGSLEGFRDLVFLLGGDPNQILKDIGLEPKILDNSNTMISTRSFRLALNHASRATNTPRFGLQLSQRQTFEKLGPVGYLMRQAPTLDVSINRLIRFLRTHDSGTTASVETDGDISLWRHSLLGVTGESVIQQSDLAIGLANKFMRTTIGDDWNADAVYFEHQRPDDYRIYERLFRCKVFFEQPITALEFPTKLLQQSLKNADPGLYQILHDYVDRIDQGIDDDFVGQVRQTIQTHLANGTPRLDDIASELGLGRHILARRLKQEGSSFQRLLDDIRFNLARRYLKDTDVPLVEISAALGFAEPAVLSRAFRRKAGMSPRAWRKKERARVKTDSTVSAAR